MHVSRFLAPKLPHSLLGISEVVNLLNILQHGLEVNLEILQQAVVEAKDPSVDNGELVLGVALLNGSCLNNITTLLLDVELHEAIVALLLVGDSIQLVLVQSVDVADVS